MNPTAPLAIVLLFILRLGVPIVLLFGVSALYQKLYARMMAGEAKVDTPCWKIRECGEQDCPARRRPGIPCWVARQITEGRLPDVCLDCPIYTHTAYTH